MPRWRGYHNLAMYMTATSVACTQDQFNKLGEYVVKAKEIISIGFGNLSGMDNAIGRIYGVLNATGPAEVAGIVRLSIVNPQDQVQKILFELPTNALNTSASNRTQQTPFPWSQEDVTEDMKLVLELKPFATATVQKSLSVLQMDMTFGNY